MTLDNSKQVWSSRNISCNSQTGIKLLLRWPGRTYMSVGYVFELRFFGRNDLTDFYDFWHP